MEGDDACTYGWWKSTSNGPAPDYSTLQDVIDSIKTFHDEAFPFDGIISFSQGAKLAHLLAQHESKASLFPNLKFLILASCYEGSHPPADQHPSIPLATPSSPVLSLPTLHVFGSSDAVVPPSSSEAVAACYEGARSHRHGGGHHVPMRSADLKVYLEFIEGVEAAAKGRGGGAPSLAEPDDDAKAEQMDELDVLSAVFTPEEFVVLSSPSSFPVVCSVLAFELEGGPVRLRFEMGCRYPEHEAVRVSLSHSLSGLQFPSRPEARCLEVARECAEGAVGVSSVMEVVTAVREWFDDGGMEGAQDEGGDETEECGETEEERAMREEREVREAEVEGLELAMEWIYGGKRIGEKLPPPPRPEDELRQKSGGGHAGVIVGLVGKPSAGKSTFFNAATGFSRQSGGEEGAKMGAAPFTTIDPNLGYAFVPAPKGEMPEDEPGAPAGVGSEHGRDRDGRRLVPVLLKVSKLRCQVILLASS